MCDCMWAERERYRWKKRKISEQAISLASYCTNRKEPHCQRTDVTAGEASQSIGNIGSIGSIGSSSLEYRSFAPDMSESLLADQLLLGHYFHGEYIVSALLHHLDDCAETALAKHLKTTTSGVSTPALMCKGGACGVPAVCT